MALASTAILAVIGIVSVRLWFPNDTVTDVSTNEVLARYRTGAASTTITAAAAATMLTDDRALTTSDAMLAQTNAPTEPASQDVPARSEDPTGPGSGRLRLPEPGVYMYATQGRETIDALTGAAHDYPAQTTITVTADGCGVRLRWDALEERGDEHVFCIEGDRLIQPSLKEHHQFFGRLSDESYVCTPPTVLLSIGGPTEKTSSGTCTNEHEEITSTWENMGNQSVETSAGKVDVIVLRNTFTSGVTPDESGKLQTSGEWGETVFSFHESGLPVRITRTKVTRTPSPVGDVNYHEDFDLTLVSFEPMR